MAYDVNLARLDAVATRITRGLYHRHAGRRLPAGYAAKAVSAAALNLDRETFDDMCRIMRTLVENTQPVGIGSVFSYFYSLGAKDAGESVFLMLFYRGVVFIGMTNRATT